MKSERRIALLALVVLVLCVSVLAHAGVASAGKFLGFTDIAADGKTGVMELNRLCQAQFSGSRMCTTREIMNTVNTGHKIPFAGWAWVKNVYNNPGDEFLSGSSGGQLSCWGWSSNASFDKGLAINGDSNFSQQKCNLLLNVSCCQR
jgi:hypothetical protein